MLSKDKKIYLIRHGETSWSAAGKHTGSTDIPLNEKGKYQSDFLKKRLEEIDFNQVFVSPMQRALETCRITGLLKNAKIDPDLKEWQYGKYEGLTTEEIYRSDPDWNIFLKGAPGGESVQQVSDRADHFLQNILLSDGQTAVFSSGHFLRVLACRWIGQPPSNGRSFMLFPASVSILGYERTVPALITWNDTFHLEKPN